MGKNNLDNLANMVDGHLSSTEMPVAKEDSMAAVRKQEATKQSEQAAPKKGPGRPKGSTKAKAQAESKMNIAPEIDKNDATAKMIVNTQSILYKAFTKEALSDDERFLSHKSFKDYFDATGGMELSPAHALLFTQGALALAKFKSAKEDSKVGKLKIGLMKKFGMWFARRKVENKMKADEAKKQAEQKAKEIKKAQAKATGSTDVNIMDLIPNE